MPTNNPKVSGYVPQALKDRLTQFREDRGISESQAVTVILAEYFGIEQELKESSKGVEVGGVTLARMEVLEQKVAELIESVNQKSELSGKPPVKTKTEVQLKLEPPSTELQPIPGQQLSEYRFGLGKSTIAGAKRTQSTKRFTEWTRSKDPDGIGWKFVENPVKGYVPADELPSELLLKLNKWITENIS